MTFTGNLRAGKHQLTFAEGRVHLMGVLNLSPESKNTPTVATSVEDAIKIAERHRGNGASIIDVGAQSSHFDNPDLDPSEEIDRLSSTVERLVAEEFVVSVDTWKPAVASAAIEIGASIINDTGGLQDSEMVRVVGEAGIAAVAMYLEGDSPLEVAGIELENSPVDRMIESLGDRLDRLAPYGVENTIVDPGIGISYRTDRGSYAAHQLEVIRSLDRFGSLGRPVLLPVPRKPELAPTLAMATLALEHGADILRVHDVLAVADIARMMEKM